MKRARERASGHLEGGSPVDWLEIAVASALVIWFYVSGLAAVVRWITRLV